MDDYPHAYYQVICSASNLAFTQVTDWLANQVGYEFENGHHIQFIDHFQIVGTGPYYHVVALCHVEAPLEDT